jgi:hypothetical protein
MRSSEILKDFDVDDNYLILRCIIEVDAGMVKLANTVDSKSAVFGLGGSIPSISTNW